MTAVEWLNAELERLTTRDGINMSWAMMNDLLQQAKEMEREQIIEAHGIKTIRTIKQGMDCFERTTGEQYYKETYNNAKV
jgi:hypothetical protein